MSEHETESSESNNISENMVFEFLRNNPDFFNQYPHIIS